MPKRKPKTKRRIYRADYGDATPEQVAAAVLNYRRPSIVSAKKPARGGG
ncbi:MAG: hypothetical protein OXS29_10070 [bacterium]|nr:hypothetical protein [bacterium]MDE0440197.1 hypothetical protein [bacterium]